MINFDDVKKEHMNEHNPKWLQISDHPYRIYRIRGLNKKKSLFNIISQ